MSDMSDPISRQQTITALRALSDEDGYINVPHEVVTDVVRGLPPVKAKQGQTTRSEQGETDKFGVKTGETCEDCISRQAAIDATWEEPTYTDPLNVLTEVRDRLEALPPAQQEIIRCKDCKWYGRVDKRRFYRGMDCLQKHIDTIVPDRDFCSKAERRGEQDG